MTKQRPEQPTTPLFVAARITRPLSWQWITIFASLLIVTHALGVMLLLGTGLVFPTDGIAVLKLVLDASCFFMLGLYCNEVSEGNAKREMLIAGLLYFGLVVLVRGQWLQLVFGPISRRLPALGLYLGWWLAFLLLGFIAAPRLRDKSTTAER